MQIIQILLSQLTLPFDEAIERTASVFPINNDPYQLPWYPPKSVLDSLLLVYCLWLDGRVPTTIQNLRMITGFGELLP